jgi:hypothetical protein
LKTEKLRNGTAIAWLFTPVMYRLLESNPASPVTQASGKSNADERPS